MSNLFEGVLAFIGVGILVLVLYYIYDHVHARKCRTKVQYIASACYNLQAGIVRIANDPFLGKDFAERIAAIRIELSQYQETVRLSRVSWPVLAHIGKGLQYRAECALANARADIDARTTVCEEYTRLLPIVSEAIQVPLNEGDSFATVHWRTLGLASSDVKGGGIFHALFLLQLLQRTYC